MAADGGVKKDFFISYAGADQAWAEWVAWVLEDAKYTVLIQAWDFHFGDNFVANMQNALEGSERTIAILSEAYFASKFCQDEWTVALAKSTPDTPRLLPIRIADVERKGLFAPIASLDLFGILEPAARDRLLAAVKQTRAKRATASPFPDVAAAPAAPIPPKPPFPGALPAIWNLAHRNPNFTGRVAQLEALRAHLTGGSTAAVTQAASISGLGGIGKSQLAIEYAYRYRADYDLAWWLRRGTGVTRHRLCHARPRARPAGEGRSRAGGGAGRGARLAGGAPALAPHLRQCGSTRPTQGPAAARRDGPCPYYQPQSQFRWPRQGVAVGSVAAGGIDRVS